MMFLLALVFPVLAFSQAPSWRQPAPAAVVGADAPTGKGADAPRTVYRDRIVRDTVKLMDTLVRLDTVYRVDTIRDTVQAFPVQYRYVIRYALTGINVETKNPEWLDYSSLSEIIARDTATLKVGVETVRALGVIIDQFGNRIPQQDIVTTGFTIQVFGDRATIEYRGKNSIAVFAGSFDRNGFLIATGEIADNSLLLNFFPFNLFFGASRKKIIIEITREAYL